MQNLGRIRERYLRDDVATRLGGIAANLARVSSFSKSPVNKEAVNGLLDESKYFIEWTAEETGSDTAAELVELQVQIACWQHRWDRSGRIRPIEEPSPNRLGCGLTSCCRRLGYSKPDACLLPRSPRIISHEAVAGAGSHPPCHARRRDPQGAPDVGRREDPHAPSAGRRAGGHQRATVEYLKRHGLIASNMKFPAATYLLPKRGSPWPQSRSSQQRSCGKIPTSHR